MWRASRERGFGRASRLAGTAVWLVEASPWIVSDDLWGAYRWVVERTFARLHGFRRLRIRGERRADIHEAFLRLACCLIAHGQINSPCGT